MIKLIGMARKREGMSHDACVKYHQEKHAPWGKRLMGPKGLVKYSACYVDEAYTLEGAVLPERPWDLIVPEWYTEEGWNSLETWARIDPEGKALMEDLGNFSDHKNGLMLIGEENVFVDETGDTSGVNAVFCAPKRDDISREDFVKYHREVHVPLVTRMLGSRLKKYVVTYVERAFSPVEGELEKFPYDIVAVTRIDEEFWRGGGTRRGNPEDKEIAEDEARLVDRQQGLALVCRERIYIP